MELIQAGGWRTQQDPKKLAYRVKQRVKQELRRKDLMPEIEASAVRDVWRIPNVKDRWRLYRRWARNLTQEFRQTIASHQIEFELGARRLKDIRNMEDLEILKGADVIGMTTTGIIIQRTFTQHNKRCEFNLLVVKKIVFKQAQIKIYGNFDFYVHKQRQISCLLKVSLCWNYCWNFALSA